MSGHEHRPDCIEYDGSVFGLGRIDPCTDYEPEPECICTTALGCCSGCCTAEHEHMSYLFDDWCAE